MAANPLESALTNYVLAIYRQWYALPYKSTRLHLRAAQNGLAAAGPGEYVAAVQQFARSAGMLPGVAALVVAETAELQRALVANGAPDAEGIARLRALLTTDDPFGTALSHMVWQPSTLEVTVFRLRTLVAAAASIPAMESVRVIAIFTDYDARSPAAKQNYAQNLALLQETLGALEALPTLRVLAWRDLLAAKVVDASQIINKLGAGTSPNVTAPTTDAPTTDLPASTTLYSDIHFPKVVKRSTIAWEPLIVRLTTKAQENSAATVAVNVPFIDPAKPEEVDVVVTAPDFEERFALWRRTIIVYADRDSQPAVFLVRSNVIGDKRITVDFYHHGRQIGSAAFASSVQQEGQPGRATPIGEGFSIEAFSTAATPPPDLELRVVRDVAANRLLFTLHSANPKVVYHYLPCGSVTLVRANPLELLEAKFERLSDLAWSDATRSAEENRRALDTMQAIGEELWDEVLPAEFKGKAWDEIRRLRDMGTIRSLQITSDEPWIPWEMVKPYTRDEITGEETQEPFWAEQFEMARWLAGRGSAAQVQVKTARLVAPDLDLAYVDEERKAFDALAALGIATAPPLQLRAEVQNLLSAGGIELLHVASHAAFNAENPERSRITLQDGELFPEDLGQSATKGLRASRPLVFLNACSAGRLGVSLTGVGGWADKMVNTGRVGAFIGTLWEVNDQLAAAFSQHFYERLFAGETLGAALLAARLHIRAIDSGNPTWLAYTLYGDPSARFTSPNSP